MVAVPVRKPPCGDALRMLELSPKEGGRDFARQKGGADILPGILVDLAAKEPAAIGAFLTHDLGTIHQFGIIHQEAAAFARTDILGFMKAETTEIADRP